MNFIRFSALSSVAMVAVATPVGSYAQTPDDSSVDGDTIMVTATQYAGTKTDTPIIETPQPITVIDADRYLSQGAISISDTVKYAAGVLANPYGRDTRVDGFTIRGLDALQFRDGMRDIFSYYASITSDPYNFSRVEILRGPASVLFGQGSIGGLVNLVTKTPNFTTGGEINLVYGSYDRKEALGDVNFAIADNLAVRFVGRARDSNTFIDHVPDDRVMFAPSIRWQPTPATDIILTGLYQEDDTGSTSQFLPIVGTFLPNRVAGAQLDRDTFVGKAGWDRYAGRSLQGAAFVTHDFSDQVKLSLKARYIDSDLEYNTHYADSYSNPQDPFSVYGTDGRTIGLTADASDARMNVFSTDNNLLFTFNTGANLEHKLLVGIDYSWNKVAKRNAGGTEIVDLYDIDYAALKTYDPTGPFLADSQKQLGIYVQDQMRFFDRVSIVLGARRDRVTGSSGQKDNANTFRQYEAGIKWQPAPGTLVTATAFKIKERNRVLYLAAGGTAQSGELNTKGFEVEASHTLPGDFELLANYGYTKLKSETNTNLDYMPRHTASFWTTKTFGLPDEAQLRLGGGVVHSGKSVSTSAIWSIVTPSRTTVDALAEINWNSWRFAVNATNLLNNHYYASCLARGDCFIGAPRNVMGTVGFRF